MTCSELPEVCRTIIQSGVALRLPPHSKTYLTSRLLTCFPWNRTVRIGISGGQSTFQLLAVPFGNRQLVQRIRNAVPKFSDMLQPLFHGKRCLQQLGRSFW